MTFFSIVPSFCLFDNSAGVGAFVIGLSQISSFFSSCKRFSPKFDVQFGRDALRPNLTSSLDETIVTRNRMICLILRIILTCKICFRLKNCLKFFGFITPSHLALACFDTFLGITCQLFKLLY